MGKETKQSYVYVCSKLASNNAYTTWKPGSKAANDMPRRDRQILIKGGAGVVDKKQLITPYGVVTKITADELALVRENCPSFVRHEKKGFLKVLDKNPSSDDVKSVSKDLKTDKSIQATEKSLKAKEKK